MTRKAPPFKARLDAAIAAAKAAGATRIKVHPDGSVEVDFKSPEALDQPDEANDFDIILSKRDRHETS